MNNDLRFSGGHVEGTQRCDGQGDLAIFAARRYSHERPFDCEGTREVRLDPKLSSAGDVRVVNRDHDARAPGAKPDAEWRPRGSCESDEVGAMVHRPTLVIVKLALEADAIGDGSDEKNARRRRIGRRQTPGDLDASAMHDLSWCA